MVTRSCLVSSSPRTHLSMPLTHHTTSMHPHCTPSMQHTCATLGSSTLSLLITSCSYLCSVSVRSVSAGSPVCPDSHLSTAPSSACFLYVFLSPHALALWLNPHWNASGTLTYSPQQLLATVGTASLTPSIMYVSMPLGRWPHLCSSPLSHPLAVALSAYLSHL